MTGESAFADIVAPKNLPRTLKTIIEEGSHSPKQIFNVYET